MTQQITGKKKLKARELEKQALRLRLAGATYQAIGDALGVSQAAAYKAIRRVLEKTVQQSTESADELRQVEITRLDMLYLKMSPLADSGSMGAVDRCLRIMERRARLLGLDAPAKTDITTDGQAITFIVERDDGQESETLSTPA